MSDLRDRLENALASDPREIASRDAARCRAALGGPLGPLVLAGAGQVGLATLAGLRELGAEPLAFIDNDPQRWGTTVEGLAVLPPDEAVASYGADVPFVATLFHTRPVLAQLRALGVVRALAYTVLFRGYPETWLPYFGLDSAEPMLAHADELRRLFDLLDDDPSRQELVEQVEWCLTLDSELLRDELPPEETYAAPDLFRLTDAETYVDFGAFDGDSVRDFVSRTGGAFTAIHAVEPDPQNVAAIAQRFAGQPEVAERLTVHPVAAGAQPGAARFAARATAGSAFDEEGTTVVPVETLDRLLGAVLPTYVKVDVEGAELELLDGARSIVASGAAVWAITCYHAQHHLWDIPARFAPYEQAYRFSLRRYADDCWETVFYAVPENRALAPAERALQIAR